MPKPNSTCKYCKKEIYVKPHQMSKNGNYCTRDCMYNSPIWKKDIADRNKRLAKDPKWRSQQIEHIIALNKLLPQNPKWIKSHKLGMQKRSQSPAWIKNYPEGIKRRSENSEWKRNLSEAASNRSPDYKKWRSEQNRLQAQDPAWREAVIQGSQKRSRDPEWRKRLSAALQGVPIEKWEGFTSFGNYCEKFDERFRDRIRSFFNYTCAECGKTTEENGEAMSCHHVYYQKSACCDKDQDGIYSVAIEGKEFTICGHPSKFVALCRSCHGKANATKTYWAKHFEELINTKYNGRSYFTEKEYEEFLKGDTQNL